MAIVSFVARFFRRAARRSRAFGRDEKGTGLLEMAVMMPFLLLLGAGVFEFGNIFYQKMLMESGIRDSARYLARCNTLGPLDCDFTKARNIAVYGDPDGGGSPRIAGWSTNLVFISYINTTNNVVGGLPEYRGGSTIQTVRVTSAHAYTGMALLRFLFINPVALRVAHEERVIGW